MAKVKVVLKEHVDKVGDPGDVTLVAGGFARNYLIPRGLAVPATKGNVKQAETWRQSRQARESKELQEAEAVRARLEASSFRVSAQAGPDGRLFGSVTQAQLSAVVEETLGVSLDRHDIQLPEPIRHVGVHEATVKLHRNVEARLTVEVVEGS